MAATPEIARANGRKGGRPKGARGAATLAREAAQKAYLNREGLTAVRVLEEIRRLAFSDIRAVFDEHGNLRSLKDLTDEQAAAVASVEVVTRNLTAGDGTVDTIHKLKVWDKPKSLEMLAKHFGLLIDKVEHGGTIEISWKGGE